jgi:hypothetical protein
MKPSQIDLELDREYIKKITGGNVPCVSSLLVSSRDVPDLENLLEYIDKLENKLNENHKKLSKEIIANERLLYPIYRRRND